MEGGISPLVGNLRKLTNLCVPSMLNCIENRNLKGNPAVSRGLSGYIPESVFDLQDLEFLFLSSNRLDGTISSKIGNLQKLRILYISFCTFTPSHSIYSALDSNLLRGSIPSSLYEIRKLESMSLLSCHRFF